MQRLAGVRGESAPASSRPAGIDPLRQTGGVCGRYVSAADRARLAEVFDAVIADSGPGLEPDYNVAPTKDVYAVVQRDERQLRVMRWGLVPSWAKDPAIGNKMINARLETAASKPAFRRAFAKRRCLLPADGYYEWYAPAPLADAAGRPVKARKQPYFIRPRDGGVMAMAGLYEFWREAEDAPWLVTCTVLTTTAPDDLGRIHDRMPLTVEPGNWSAWLDPEHEPDTGLLRPAAPGVLEAYPVSTEVNNVRNNGPQLLDPIPLSGPEAGA